jgi:Zn-dependent protease
MFGDPFFFIVRLIALFIALPLHELAHAVTADRLGDDTPRQQGRLTLNPLAHLDPLGSIMLLVGVFGWAKPVMTAPWKFSNGPRTGTAIVALAGPVMNFSLAVLAAIPYRLGLPEWMVDVTGPQPAENAARFLVLFGLVNLSLAFFNLLPIGPLDGLKVLRGVSPRQWDPALDALERWGMFILLALIVLPAVGLGFSPLGWLLDGPIDGALQLLFGR